MEQNRIQTFCLIIITAVALAVALRWLAPMLIPFVLAIFISFALSALLDAEVELLRLPRVVALLATMMFTIIAFALMGAFVASSIRELTANASGYEQSVNALINRIIAWLPVDADVVRERVVAPFRDVSAGTVSSIVGQLTTQITGILSRSLLVLMFVTFLLVGRSSPSQSQGVWLEIETRVKRYVLVKGATSVLTGTTVGVTLWMLNVDLAFVFGMLAFMLNIIPSIGSVIATLLPLPVVLVSPDVSSLAAVLAIAIPGAIQFAVGNVLEPKIMGENLDLHPVTVLMSLIFWGMLWGIVGALLAVPMTAVTKILLDRLEPTKPFAEIMAGRLPGNG